MGTKQLRGKYAKAKGTAGESIAHYALNGLGLKMVAKIQSGWEPHRWIDRKRGIAMIHPMPKVAGDFHAITETGKSVLVEVKHRKGNLIWSSFASHQKQRLTEHAGYGGLSIIVWVASDDVFILQWPIEGFGPRKSITHERATEIDMRNGDAR